MVVRAVGVAVAGHPCGSGCLRCTVVRCQAQRGGTLAARARTNVWCAMCVAGRGWLGVRKQRAGYNGRGKHGGHLVGCARCTAANGRCGTGRNVARNGGVVVVCVGGNRAQRVCGACRMYGLPVATVRGGKLRRSGGYRLQRAKLHAAVRAIGSVRGCVVALG